MVKKIVLPLFAAVFAAACVSAGAPDWSDWRVIERAGGTGTTEILPDGSRSFAKTSPAGWVELRLNRPVWLKGGVIHYFRVDFQAENVKLGTILLLRLPTSADGLPYYSSSGDRGTSLATETLLINSSAGQWHTRTFAYRPSRDFKYYPTVVLAGNPAAVRLRNFRINTISNVHCPASVKPEPEDMISQAALEEKLTKQAVGTARLVTGRNGITNLELDGQDVAPVIYNIGVRNEYARHYDFFSAGIKLATLQIPASTKLRGEQIVLGPGRFNYAAIDRLVYETLRKSPDSRLIVKLNTYEPWPGWSEKYPEELWKNEQGESGYGNNCHLKYFQRTGQPAKFREPVTGWPSYSSERWRKDISDNISGILRHIMSQPYGKSVVGVFFTGGDDGQYQYRQDDFSIPSCNAFRKFLKRKYGSISQLNEVWKSSYSSFGDVLIPSVSSASFLNVPPFLPHGAKPDYREFQNEESIALRECFASAAKRAAGKPILTGFYTVPEGVIANRLHDVPSLDIIVRVLNYPYRANSYPYGYPGPEAVFRSSGKLYLNELDMRSWTTSSGNEFTDRWQGAQLTPDAWRNSHRKQLGPFWAQRQGWWYYSMDYLKGPFFDAPEIMEEIRKTVEIHRRYRAMPATPFRPDVCVIFGDSADRYCLAKPYRASGNWNAQGNSYPFQMWMLETSGVPFDLRFLDEVLDRPEYWNYKVYIFINQPYISDAQREKIELRLKRDNKYLVFLGATGYLDDKGKSVEAQQRLTGFVYHTDETYSREEILAESTHPWTAGAQTFLSFGDLRLFAERPFGVKLWAQPFQSFRLGKVDPAEVLCRYRNGEVAGAVRRHPRWTSVVLSGQQSLSNVILNHLAKAAGAYSTGSAGQSIYMNGNFVSLHGLYDTVYRFRPPFPDRKMVDAHSGEILGTGVEIPVKLKAGETRWLFMTR